MIAQRSFAYLLAFLTALLCTLAAPSFATSTVQQSEIPSTQAQNQAQNQAQTLEQQGKALYEAGQFEQAVLVLQQAARQYQQQEENLRQAIVLSNLALTYEKLGIWTNPTPEVRVEPTSHQWANANTAIAASLELLNTITLSHPGNLNPADYADVQAQVLDVQGRLQLTQGQAEAALVSWQQAAPLYEQLEDAAGLMANQVDQSRALQTLGFYQRAIELLVQVLHFPDQVAVRPDLQPGLNQTSVSREEILGLQPSLLRQENRLSLLKTLLQPLSPARTTAVALQSLGKVLHSSGSLAQADVILQHSLVMAEHQTAGVKASILLDLGNIARAQDHQEAALEFYRDAAKGGEATTQTRSQLNELSLWLEQSEWDKAQLLLPSIQQQIQSLPPSQTSLYTKINFAHSLIKGIGHVNVNAESSSTDYMVQLLTTTEQDARNLGDWRAVAYATGSLGKLYKVTQQWNEAERWTRQAVELAQRVNASDMTYLWLWQLGQILKAESTLETNILEQARYMVEARTAYGEALKVLKSIRYDLTSVSQDEQFNFRDAIEPAYRERAELLLTPLPGSELSSEDLDTTRTTLEELQIAELQNFLRQACDDAFVAIDQIVEAANRSQANSEQNHSTTAVIYPVILPGQLHVILKLPQQNQLYHYSTSIKAEDVEQKLDELHQNLRDVTAENQVKQLAQEVYTWLIAPGQTQLQNHQIDTLVFVLDGSFKRIPMAVLYDGNQYLIQKYSIALSQGLKMPNPQPLDRKNIQLLLAGLSQEVPGEEFPPLKSVTVETNSIHAEISESTVLLNDEFTAEALQSLIEKSRFQVVHLATHGEFSANQDDTFILAADRRINVLELAQVLRTRNQTQSEPLELLVLSACQTAQGDQRAALGLSGVAVRAGARSTIGSLWNVDDESGAALMVAFYQQWKNHPDYTKAKALQEAQIEILKIYTSPRLWAPFILLGSWL